MGLGCAVEFGGAPAPLSSQPQAVELRPPRSRIAHFTALTIQELREPLRSDMANDEIFVSKDSIHILKHHGSYMQQARSRWLARRETRASSSGCSVMSGAESIDAVA